MSNMGDLFIEHIEHCDRCQEIENDLELSAVEKAKQKHRHFLKSLLTDWEYARDQNECEEYK